MRKIEFVSYNGKYPNLCSGWLSLKIDGEPWSKYVHLFPKAECYIGEDGDEVLTKGPWDLTGFEYDRLINAGFTDEETDEIIRLLDENVEQGCCGGCL